VYLLNIHCSVFVSYTQTNNNKKYKLLVDPEQPFNLSISFFWQLTVPQI